MSLWVKHIYLEARTGYFDAKFVGEEELEAMRFMGKGCRFLI
jgi:hypothetical protein